MPYPDKPDPTYGYVAPVPAHQVKIGFDDHKQSIDELIDFLKVSIRSDNKISTKMVPAAALAPDAVALIGGWNPRGEWTTATSYKTRDVVNYGTFTYVCVTAHTSGVFSDELGHWMYLTFEQPTSYAAPLFADVKALLARPAIVVVNGKATVNDGFGGHFYWAAGDVTMADDLDTIQPTYGEPGRYKRLDCLGRSDIAVAGIDALRAYKGPAAVALVSQGTAFGDGDGGHFAVKASDTTTPDNGKDVIVDALGRRWWRLIHNVDNTILLHGMPGIDETGVADSSTAINALLAAYAAEGCTLVVPRDAKIKLTADVVINTKQAIIGSFSPTDATGIADVDYAKLPSQMILASGATIRLDNGGRLERVLVY